MYHAETVTVVAQDNKPEIQVEGDDTPEVKVFAHDVFPPTVPSGLQAVSSGPGQKTFIDLVWAPVSDVDLDGYNVYRHEDGTPAVKVNAQPLKTPAYRDSVRRLGQDVFLFGLCRRRPRQRERTFRRNQRGRSVRTSAGSLRSRRSLQRPTEYFCPVCASISTDMVR